MLLTHVFDQVKEHLSAGEYRVLSAGPRRHEPHVRGGSAGGVLLAETVRASGLDVGLSAGLGRWRKPSSTQDPRRCVQAVSSAARPTIAHQVRLAS